MSRNVAHNIVDIQNVFGNPDNERDRDALANEWPELYDLLMELSQYDV